MIVPLLLAVAAPQDAAAMIESAADGLSITCEGPECAAPPKGARYRITGESSAVITSKDRAIRNDGSYCNVVGARRCTKSGRKIFSTGLGN